MDYKAIHETMGILNDPSCWKSLDTYRGIDKDVFGQFGYRYFEEEHYAVVHKETGAMWFVTARSPREAMEGIPRRAKMMAAMAVRKKARWQKIVTYYCPICGDESNYNTQFCPECGADLREDKGPGKGD